MFEFKSLLVPVDFSAMSRAAFDYALKLASGEGLTLILLHVVDTSLVEFGAALEMTPREQILHRMRDRAALALESYSAPAGSPVEIQSVISEGTPFLEIVRKASEFYVDAIVMGRYGTRGRLENLLFGSTAERVLRGSLRPVFVLPVLQGG
jgi:glycine betaine transporter